MDKAHELIKKLGQSDDYFERQKAAWALVNLGDEAVDAVAEALEKGEFSDLRYKSAWILGKTGSARALKPLCYALLSDPDHVVREWSAAAMEALGNQEAVQPLVLAMKRDGSRDVRLRAAMALRALEAAEAFRDLLSYDDPEVRGMATTGLAKIGYAQSLPDVARLITDEDAEVRRRAAAYMGEIAREEILLSVAEASSNEVTQFSKVDAYWATKSMMSTNCKIVVLLNVSTLVDIVRPMSRSMVLLRNGASAATFCIAGMMYSSIVGWRRFRWRSPDLAR